MTFVINGTLTLPGLFLAFASLGHFLWLVARWVPVHALKFFSPVAQSKWRVRFAFIYGLLVDRLVVDLPSISHHTGRAEIRRQQRNS